MKKKALTPIQAPFTAIQKENMEKFKQLVRDTMPKFVTEIETKEDMANSMFEAGQELYLVVEDMLRRYHKFTDDDLKKLRREVTDVLSGVKEYERAGLNILSPHSVGIVGDMHEEGTLFDNLAELSKTRFDKGRFVRSKIEYPVLKEAVPFLKKLKEKNKK